jgi:transcriptional regulator with XRE-family HTH domain
VTQEQLATALKVNPRTIQNWEAGVGLSQLEKRAADIAEFVDIMNDYVRREKQSEWLRAPNEAFGGETPLELLMAGSVRNAIVEFRRLQAGQPCEPDFQTTHLAGQSGGRRYAALRYVFSCSGVSLDAS